MSKTPAGIPATKEQLKDAYTVIVNHLRSNTKNPELLANFVGTEDRAVRALIETCLSDDEISKLLAPIVAVEFPVSRHKPKARGQRVPAGSVTQGPITVNSCCPHHLMPVRYHAHVAYIPGDNGGVLGLSKLARICKLLGRRPVLQEQLAEDIADVLSLPNGEGAFPSLASAGAAVSLVGMHTCMACRGVEENALTSVTALRGDYWEPEMEQKFQNSVQGIKTTNLR